MQRYEVDGREFRIPARAEVHWEEGSWSADFGVIDKRCRDLDKRS